MSSPNYVWELSDSFLAWQDGIVAVLQVFMDESGTHDDSSVITVGAAWAKKSVWKKWTKDWNREKAPILVHHSTDCHNRKCEYDGWSCPKRDDYVKRILPVIAKHRILGRISGLHLNSYKTAISRRPEVAAVFGEPYIACFQWAVIDVCKASLKSGHKRVAFVHENNDYQFAAHRAFDYAIRSFPQMTLSIGFACKRQYVPLQCADVFAFEGNRRLRDTAKPTRKPMEVIDPAGDRIGFIEYDERNMPQYVETMFRLFDDLRPHVIERP